MKRIILLLLVKCSSITCNHIASTKKALETSTVSSSNDFPDENKASGKTKNVLETNRSNVYLEDVIYTLKNQDWTDDEIPCLNRSLAMLNNFSNFTLWSVWEWDSMSSQPLGLLYGSQYHLGNFDECLNPPWRDSHPELRSKYCLADIVLERTDKHEKKVLWEENDPYQSTLHLVETKSVFGREIKKLTWGMCVPAECGSQSVQRLTKVMLAHTHLSMAGLNAQVSTNETCQENYPNQLPYDALFYSFIALIFFLTSTVLICTFVSDRNNNNNSFGGNVIKAFDIRSNIKSMLKPSEELHVLYGIKVLSMCVVVLCHQIGIFNGGPISNGANLDKESTTFAGVLILHVDMVVDSFYMLSGFLTAANVTKLKYLPNLFIIIFKRFTRLIVPYAMVIFYVVSVYPYTGSGPLWDRAIANDTAQCRRNWWINLLMLSNYIDSENVCIPVSWYIPTDFHFSVVSLLLYGFYRRYPRLGSVVVALVALVAVVLPGISTYINKFPPIPAFNFEFLSNPRSFKQFNELYIKSHMRYAPYIVGFLAGYVYVRPSLIQYIKRMSQNRLSIITYVTTVGMFACMYLGSIMFLREPDLVVSAVYAALNRPLWAFGLSLIVLCCAVGHVPFVKGILSWYPWVPLSRLSYGVYLTHTIFITRNVYVARNLQHYDMLLQVTWCAGVLLWSYVAALYLWIVAEAPLNNLVTLLMRRKLNFIKEKNITADHNSTDQCNDVNTNRGYLDENLPSSVQIVSSKF